MENYDDSNTPFVIKVDLKCCNKCPNRLRKALLKVAGVQSVDISQQKNLVIVTGEVDPTMLLDLIKSSGKEASLGSLNDVKKTNNYHNPKQGSNNNKHSDGDHHFEEIHDHNAARVDKCPQYFQETQQNQGRKCYCKGDPNYNKKRRDANDHVVENFEGPRFEELDENICKDAYCRIHRRNHGSVPQGYDTLPMNWGNQPYGLGSNGYFPVGRNYPRPPPPFFRDGHLPPPPPHPYGYASPLVPPPPYGGSYYPLRPQFGHVYYGDEGSGGCSTM